MPFGRLSGRAGRVGGMVVGFIPAVYGVDRGGSICGEGIGAKNEVWGAGLPTGVLKPVNTGRAGKLAKIETGCCFFSGDDGRTGNLAKDEVGGSFFPREEERDGMPSSWILASLAFNSSTSDMYSCFSRFNCSISVSLSSTIFSSR